MTIRYSTLCRTLLVILVIASACARSTWIQQKTKHSYRSLQSPDDLISVAAMSNMDAFRDVLLRPILIERVPDTIGNAMVRQHIVDYLTSHGWTVELDAFNDSTPFGPKMFVNIVATQNPMAPRRLTLACHYDSKLMNGQKFIGATDSAVPCAMLLDQARSLNTSLFTPSMFKAREVSLQLIFFDGEEAFIQWTSSDSLYGARHLAEKMAQTTKRVARELWVSELETIDLLILLDLIGVSSPTFLNFFPDTTGSVYKRLQSIETKLKETGLLKRQDGHKYFPRSEGSNSYIQDDHVPFISKDVNVLHLIATPFPHVWHKANDDESALDYDTIDDLNIILRVFISEYLRLH